MAVRTLEMSNFRAIIFTSHFKGVTPVSNVINFNLVHQFSNRYKDHTIEDSWVDHIIEQADTCLSQMIKFRQTMDLRKAGRTRDAAFADELDNSDDWNNIIAFTGDRGSGKTTAMLRFIEHIANPNYPCDAPLICMPIVDPSRISDGENLLGHIVAHMYNEIKSISKKRDSWKRTEHAEEIEKFRSVASSCAEVFQNIRIKSLSVKESMQEFTDETDFLSLFASTVALRKQIIELVKKYLRLMDYLQGNRNSKGNDGFLIIPIDDLDTNIVNGYTIAEEIHHFLMIPNVIILLSVKMEQLSDLVEQKFLSDYTKMLDSENILDAQPAEMAVKYLQKIIPVPRRITMQKLQLHTLRDIRVIIQYESESPDSAVNVPLVDHFQDLVYKKTGIILVKDEHKGHSLIPLSLRALHHALLLFGSLHTVDLANWTSKEGSVQINLASNLDRVEAWLIDSISSNAVPRDLANLFRRAAQHPIEGFCAYLAQNLGQYAVQISKNKGDFSTSSPYANVFGNDDAVHNIFAAEQPLKTISLGDIFYLLDKMLEVNSGEGYRHFAAAIHMLLSLRVTSLLYLPHEPNCEGVSTLLGDMIVNPAVRLTSTGYEWSPNVQISSIVIHRERDESLCYFNGESASDKAVADDSNRVDISEKIARWLSFFLAAPCRVTAGRDLHIVPRRQQWTDHVPYFQMEGLRGEQVPTTALACFHWMRFATALLQPKGTLERLLWMVDEDYKTHPQRRDEGELAKSWWNRDSWGLPLPLPLNSIDYLHNLIACMNSKRWESEIGKNDPYQYRSFWSFKKNVVDAMRMIEERLPPAMDNTQKKQLLDGFMKNPLFTGIFESDSSQKDDDASLPHRHSITKKQREYGATSQIDDGDEFRNELSALLNTF